MLRRFVLLATPAGLAGIVLGLSKYHATYVDPGRYDFTESSRWSWAIGMIVLLISITYAVGLPDPPRGKQIAIAKPLLVGLTVSGLTATAQFVLSDQILPRFVVVGTALLTIPYLMACSLLMGLVHRRQVAADRIMVIGPSVDHDELTAEVALGPERALSLVSVTRPSRLWSDDSESPDRSLIDQIHHLGVSVLVLDRSAQEDPRMIRSASDVHREGVRVRTLLEFYEEWLGKLPVSELERSALLFDIAEIHQIPYQRAKRAIDLMVAIPLTALFVLVSPIVLLGNLIANRGPMFFTQERIGKDGDPFTIYKLRSMRREVTSSDRSERTATEDMRVTPFGRLLRVTHVDELPQCLNILKGDLSIVGPRPEQTGFVEELRRELPFYDVRHLVRPGLTGWAQVKYGYASTTTDSLHKLQYEFWYLRHQSLALDLKILMRTVRHVLLTGGR